MPKLPLWDRFDGLRKSLSESLKGDKEGAALLKAVKDSAKLESVLKTLEEALEEVKPAAVREAYAELKPLAAKYASKVKAEIIKVVKENKKAKKKNQFEFITVGVTEETIKQANEFVAGFLHPELQKAAKEVVGKSETVAALMEPTALRAEWSRVKKIFEAETGKKKPSEKLMLVYRKSANLETALKAIDLATKNNKADLLKKACAAFEKAATDYGKIVFKQAKVEVNAEDQGAGNNDNENDIPDYTESVKRLLQGLNRCRKIAKAALDNAG